MDLSPSGDVAAERSVSSDFRVFSAALASASSPRKVLACSSRAARSVGDSSSEGGAWRQW